MNDLKFKVWKLYPSRKRRLSKRILLKPKSWFQLVALLARYYNDSVKGLHFAKLCCSAGFGTEISVRGAYHSYYVIAYKEEA